MYKDLNHLNKEQIEDLMARYYACESVKKLISAFKLDVYPSALYKLFPPAEYDNYSCEYCGNVLVLDRPSKESQRYERDLYCPACGHKPYCNPPCQCENCKQAQQELKEYQLELIKTTYMQPREQVSFEELSFENKVLLGALCRVLLRENLYEISPYTDIHMPLAPTDELKKQIYDDLIHEHIIMVSPTSSLEAFDTEHENFPDVFFIYRATYNLNLEFPANKQDLFTKILSPTYYGKEFEEEARILWQKIAVAECVEYLIYQLENVGFVFTPGEKTYKTFEIILEDFSVSQVYGIIWKAVADASKLYLEKGMSKNHAANTTISACERYAERAKINGWDLKGYSRIKELPQSALSLFFFNRVLEIGDMGFKLPPTIA
nr:hypothetical protein [uncultured Caproiciproducens sp.]